MQYSFDVQGNRNIFTFNGDFMAHLYKKFNLNVSDLVILQYLSELYESSNSPTIFIDSPKLGYLLSIVHLTRESFVRRMKKISKSTKTFFMSHLEDIQAKELLCSGRDNYIKNNIGLRTCEWCGIRTYMLEQHHYPIRKKDGGKDLVDICPNCHRSFHYLTDYKNYIVKIADLMFFQEIKKNTNFQSAIF